MADKTPRPPGLNYIQLVNQFWKVFKESKFKGNESLLYFGLLHKCNSLNWKNPFRESGRHLSESLGMSENTLRKSRIALIEAGLIAVTLPEKASKSIEGSAIYFIIQNVATPSKIEVVDEEATPSKIEVQPPQKLMQTPSKIEVQPPQKLMQTNKPSLNLIKTSFYKEEIKTNFDNDQLNQKYNNIMHSINYWPHLKGKQFSSDEFIFYLQNYFPDEIDNVLTTYAKRYIDHSEAEAQLSICEILDKKLPEQRQHTEKTINNAIKGCTKVLQMPKQLTTYEKLDLLKHANYEYLRDAFNELENNSNYRNGDSVFWATKKNLELTKKWN